MAAHTPIQQHDWKHPEASMVQRHRRNTMQVMSFSISSDAHSAPSKLRKRNLFLRIVDTIGEANRRKAEREIARFVTLHGGRITDSVERSIGERLDQH
jgi:hypothetical protein